MKSCTRFLAILTAAGCILSACGSSGESGGSGGDSGSGGQNGSGGQTGSGGKGSGGSASGGATGSGGSASGGQTGSGGKGSGGSASASGGATGSGGSGSGGSVTSSGGAAGGSKGSGGTAGSGAGNNGGAAGGSKGSGGAAGGSKGSGGAGGTAVSNGGDSGTSNYNPCPTDGSPCKILPVGDSITFGINYAGSYRPELFHKALMAGQKITYTGTLMNGPTTVDGMPFPQRYEATSGITIAGISQQITTNKTLNMPSDIVLIHIGTNDMYMSDPGGAPDRLGMLIDQLIAGYPNALIAVAKIIPLSMSASNVATYNAAIPGVVATRVAAGKHVIVVDLNTGFPSADMDTVHPYQDGYEWMGDKWYAAIGNLFPM